MQHRRWLIGLCLLATGCGAGLYLARDSLKESGLKESGQKNSLGDDNTHIVAPTANEKYRENLKNPVQLIPTFPTPNESKSLRPVIFFDTGFPKRAAIPNTALVK